MLEVALPVCNRMRLHVAFDVEEAKRHFWCQQACCTTTLEDLADRQGASVIGPLPLFVLEELPTKDGEEEINNQNDRILLKKKNPSEILAWFLGNFEEKGNTPKKIGSLKMSSSLLRAHNRWWILKKGLDSNIAAKSSHSSQTFVILEKGLNIAASSRLQNLRSSSKSPQD